MKVAVTIWKGLISPVADLSQDLLLVDVGSQSILSRHHEHFENDSPFHRAKKLDDLGVKTLICGAISSFYGALVEGYGIRLISFVHGQADEVLDAFLNNVLIDPKFVMSGYLPACNKRGRTM
jgi:predicted Fe-Mo cluster-binding NifX family protein